MKKTESTKRVPILGVPFDSITIDEALAATMEKLRGHHGKFFIATPNPEMLLATRKNESFLHLLNQTDLNIPDGFGIMLAAYLSGKKLKQRITGTDFMQTICHYAPRGTKIFLLGAGPGVAEKTKEVLEKRYPQIQISGTYAGSPAPEDAKKIIERINTSQAHILFVAFGAPKQEMWLAQNLTHLQSIKVAMGVGGAFDFIAGVIKRAPTWMRKAGLEWLYRLFKQPQRIGRIFNATIKFPVVLLLSRFTKKR